jgi:transposase
MKNGLTSKPVIPPAKVGGNRRRVNVREIVNGIMYVLSTGSQWRAIPKDLPPRSTLFEYLDLWSFDGTLDRMHHTWSKAAVHSDLREDATKLRDSFGTFRAGSLRCAASVAMA